MATNQRIFYACQAVAIQPRGTATTTAAYVVHGLQSVGMSSTFTLDQVFEMGQVEIYENIEQVADIEVTLEKVIDGYKLIYDLATGGACKTGVVGASKVRSDVLVAVFDDGNNQATGVPRNVCYNSGMYVSSVSYSYSVDGSATESVTMVGNDRYWNTIKPGGQTTATAITASGIWGASNPTVNFANGNDAPPSGVVRRTNVLLGAGASTLPAELDLGKGDDPVGNSSNRHLQSISISTDFGQENIQELGRFGPYTRYATFPIEVTAEFEVVATSGDLISVSGTAENLQPRQIVIKDDAGTVIDLGGNNKLSSVSYSGGDTGGGNVSVSYSYSNFNVLQVDGGRTHA